MGRKRKQKSEEEIRRKIKKLEDQLAASTNNNGAILPEEISNSVMPDRRVSEYPLSENAAYAAYTLDESPVPDTVQYDEATPYPPSSHRHSPLYHASPPIGSLCLSPQPPTSPPLQPGTSAEGNEITCIELDEDILQLLGDAPRADTCLGPPIHKDVANRWQHVLAKGLSKDVKDSLLKDYLVPSNCDLLLAPALNPEVKAALPDALVKRDISLVYKQKQLGIALSALAAVTEMVLGNETSKQKILKPLSDACRILCDSHFTDTRTRRNFVISSINTKLKDALVESCRDKFLFSENVAEKLKAAKTIQQSGEALKNAQKPKFQRANIASTSGAGNKNRLNYAPQHRKTHNKPNDGRRATNYTQHPSTNNNVRRPTDRSLPARTPAPQRR